MARGTRRTDEEQEGRRSARRGQKKGPPVVPLLLLGVLLVGTILLARQIAQQQGKENDEKPQETEEELFSNVPDEAPPTADGFDGSGSSSREIAPPSVLAENPTWIEALAVGEEADALLAEANRANENGDRTTWNLKGKQAKEAYDRAWTMTMALEEEFSGRYDDRDRVLRKLKRQREEWNKKKIVLHKTTAR